MLEDRQGSEKFPTLKKQILISDFPILRVLNEGVAKASQLVDKVGNIVHKFLNRVDVKRGF